MHTYRSSVSSHINSLKYAVNNSILTCLAWFACFVDWGLSCWRTVTEGRKFADTLVGGKWRQSAVCSTTYNPCRLRRLCRLLLLLLLLFRAAARCEVLKFSAEHADFQQYVCTLLCALKTLSR